MPIDKYRLAKQKEEEAILKEKEFLEGDSISPAKGRVLSILFERVGDYYKSAEKSLEANKNYNKAKIYANSYENISERIKAKIEDVTPASGLEKLLPPKKLPAFLAIASLLASLVFVSSSLTGNVITQISQNDSRWMGLCFFLCGLVFSFIYLRKK
jgi:hypothetical protein